ncbi:MAG TPA: hydantoinase/oxoprolinase family protein, partial [Candidatus Methylomirabilis sp.]|nr:hydantoinase/oxoprolinase family protein [Candidatus Methylomirabilis sp.]
MRVGVEVGGTFTDLVVIDGERIAIAKVPSTPSRPDEGALAAIEAASLPLGSVTDLVHGSTVATNAILERKGAAIALLVTRGFRDILLLQRHSRRRIYDLFYRKPTPVVGRADTFEVAERTGSDGAVIEPLDEAALAAVLDRITADPRYEAVALCLLNAYANPSHERRVADLIRARRPDLPVTCSSDVTREFREYERASSVSLAAYVQPVIEGYLARLTRALAGRGFAGRFSVMQSNGGRLPAEAVARNAITALFSGPAAGVTGAVRQAGQSGFADLITFDMGGTSTDVCLVSNGVPAITSQTEVDGLPVRTPVLDIVSVGAGGGSIVWVDDGGLLRVGPRSAGADPGPACYGRGGNDPTITDAHLIRGTIQASAFLGGRMKVDETAAARVFAPLVERLGMGLRDIADSAVRVAEASIVRA